MNELDDVNNQDDPDHTDVPHKVWEEVSQVFVDVFLIEIPIHFTPCNGLSYEKG